MWKDNHDKGVQMRFVDGVFKSFGHAFCGIEGQLRNPQEWKFRIFLACGAMVLIVPLASFAALSTGQWSLLFVWTAIIVLAVGTSAAFEMSNATTEIMIDELRSYQCQKVRVIKDRAAGTSCISLLSTMAVCVIFFVWFAWYVFLGGGA